MYRGCPAWTHRCAPESRITLRQRANPLSCSVESYCSVMVVFVFVVVVEVVRNAFGCNSEYLLPFSTGSALQAFSRRHSQSFVSVILFVPFVPSVPLVPSRIRSKFSEVCGCSFRFVILLKISSKCSYLLSAVSQSVLFTQIQICFFLGRLINVGCCRVCPWISL